MSWTAELLVYLQGHCCTAEEGVPEKRNAQNIQYMSCMKSIRHQAFNNNHLPMDLTSLI
jgi:hypothetical protein